MNGWEGIFQISNIGNVKRFYKNGTTNILKGVIKRGGYKGVLLKTPEKFKCETIHRLVAKAFIPNPDNLPCVNHKDEDKLNNTVENLEWCTHKYNNSYGTKNKRVSKKKTNNTYNMTPVLCIETNVTYPTMQEASRQTGIAVQGIQLCCKGTTYSTRNGYTHRHTAGGYHWKYAIPVVSIPKSFSKKVKCIETNEVYNSIAEAQKITGINNISRVCRKQKLYKTAGGYHWEFVNDLYKGKVKKEEEE